MAKTVQYNSLHEELMKVKLCEIQLFVSIFSAACFEYLWQILFPSSLNTLACTSNSNELSLNVGLFK